MLTYSVLELASSRERKSGRSRQSTRFALAERNKPKRRGTSTSEKRDPLAYMAMTRATHGTVVVEPHAARFARHYRIRAVEGGGFAAEDADGAMGEMSASSNNTSALAD